MKRCLAALVVHGVLVAAPPQQPSALGSAIQSLIAKSPVAATAHWGIEIADLATGATLYKFNEDKFFVPASNAKLFTTAFALSRLGARYRIETNVTAVQPPGPDGLLACDLVLKGGGDPSLRSDDLETLAGLVYERGIRKIDGSVIGDDTAFVWEPYNPGWSIDDAVEGYGAPVSALTLNDNSITLHLSVDPSEGATFRLEPDIPLFVVENQLRLDDVNLPRIHYDRLPGSDRLRLWGSMHSTAKDPQIPLGVEDPALYAAMAFKDALLRRGIEVPGQALACHREPGVNVQPHAYPIVLATHQSPPLIEDLRVTEKTSQNLHTETYLRLVANQRTRQGARTAGLVELAKFLGAAGVDPGHYSLQDGSGLSRLDVATPHALVALLGYMSKSAFNDAWMSMLPVGGTDGTLEHRMKTKAVKGKVVAKTGSLSHVSALSGYALRPGGKRYAFSILVNNFNGPASAIHEVIDKICGLLVE